MGRDTREDAHQRDASGGSDAEGGKRPVPVLAGPPHRVAPGDWEHLPRLGLFRAAHPGVIIGQEAFSTWSARIPAGTGETFTVRHRLGDLLDRLDEMGLHAVPDG